MDRELLTAAQAGLTKLDDDNDDGGASGLLATLEEAAGPIRAGASILDFGCGMGKGVQTLLDRGYDAHGVDIYEYWDRDRDLYWASTDVRIPEDLRKRLRVATLVPYALPFPDAAFDHIISSQVLEHVQDLDDVFVEIARTLKPGGTSIHVFPSRWAPPIESHIGVPIPILCKNSAYLKAMAILGVRSPRQRGLPWTEVYDANWKGMKITHYPSLREVVRKARNAGLDARYVADCAHARPQVLRLHRALTGIGLPVLAKRVVKMLQQPRLILSRVG